MPRRITHSQIRSRIRQAEANQRRAIDNYNRQVRQHNAKVKRAVDAYNREVRKYNTKRRRAIDTVNRNIREYNNRVRANQTRLRSARTTLVRRQLTSDHYLGVHQSAIELSTAYDLLDNSGADPYLSDLAERETANSLTVANSLAEDVESESFSDDAFNITKITTELSDFSHDLNNRWNGALYALDPRNPEAARHFCTSSREIISSILNTIAPDAEVMAYVPDCPRTERGTPTRRAKIRYCLVRLGVANDDLENFIDTNVRDLNTLFADLNAGAHGPSNKFNSQQLASIKTRVEDSIVFARELMPR